MPPEGREPADEQSSGDDASNRLSLRLPPFRLPAFFPPDFRLRVPIPGRLPSRRVSARTVLLACLTFDLVDALLAVVVGTPIVGVVRSVGGLLLAATVAELLGLVYGWELLAVLLGVPEVTVLPTLTILLLVHARTTQ